MNHTQQHPEQLFHSLEAPILQYGQGVFMNLQIIPFEDILQQLKENKDSALKIIADPQVIIKTILLEDKLAKKYLLVNPSESKLTALHYAGNNKIHVITIPTGVILKTPIQIRYSADKTARAETIVIVAEPRSEAVVIEQRSDQEQVQYTSSIVQVQVQQEARVTYYSVSNKPRNSDSKDIVIKRGVVKRSGLLRWCDVVEGNFIHQTILSTLQEEGAEAKNYVLFIGKKEALYDLQVEVIHAASSTKSILKTRGVLQDAARAICRNSAKIESTARNSTTQQRNDTLLLSEKARCDALPILDVAQDDVTCSHAVTVSQPDAEQLFYLLSRGIEEETARQMIIAGFLEQMMNEFPTISTAEQNNE